MSVARERAAEALRPPERASSLEELVASEVFRPAPEAATRLADAVRARHGDAVAAVLFYGSCLRRGSDEGVLDFYAVVDDYDAAYESWLLTRANALLPPNVFYLEVETPRGTLRSKYAVVSSRDFARATGGGALRPGFWARFSQPFLAAWVRDAAARDAVVEAGVRSIRTAVERLAPLLPEGSEILGASFWQLAFRETYACEMRTESPDTIRGLYEAAPERFDVAARLARAGGPASPDARRRAARAWRMRRPLAKGAYALQLLKTAFTFGDWLPYVLWKLERHTGTRLVPTERQRRHPLVFAWPLLFRALRRGDLR